jgi:hypothetical protein
LQFGQSKIPASLTPSPFLKGLRDGMGHVLTGFSTAYPHLGQLTKYSPQVTIWRNGSKICFADDHRRQMNNKKKRV